MSHFNGKDKAIIAIIIAVLGCDAFLSPTVRQDTGSFAKNDIERPTGNFAHDLKVHHEKVLKKKHQEAIKAHKAHERAKARKARLAKIAKKKKAKKEHEEKLQKAKDEKIAKKHKHEHELKEEKENQKAKEAKEKHEKAKAAESDDKATLSKNVNTKTLSYYGNNPKLLTKAMHKYVNSIGHSSKYAFSSSNIMKSDPVKSHDGKHMYQQTVTIIKKGTKIE